ncbi:MAG: prepilin-type N-terminal cleavage/methylation domain-containing protein [Fimbriimonadaceae bacterium]
MDEPERNRAALTLVEVLVVVTIVAVLAAVLMPVMVKAKRSAYSTVEVSALRQLYVALSIYEEDDGGADPATLVPTQAYVTARDLYTSPVDVMRPPLPNGSWPAAPLADCSVSSLSGAPFKISYAYLRTEDPFTFDLNAWNRVRLLPDVGILASPWTGWSANSVLLNSKCGPPIEVFNGPVMDGPINRMQMDGSLFRWHHTEVGAFGASVPDLFYRPFGVPGWTRRDGG